MRTSILLHALALLLFLSALSPTAAVSQEPVELFFSEYVEGSGLFNKALEIYNPTTLAVDTEVEDIRIEIYEDGSATPGITIIHGASSGVVIEPGTTFVMADFNGDAELTARADDLVLGLSFDGNDAIVLKRGGTIVDVIGQVGFDPGPGGWGGGVLSTQNHTLRRTASVCVGDPDGSDAFDPNLQWVDFEVDAFDGLGEHVSDCGGVQARALGWGMLKACYGSSPTP